MQIIGVKIEDTTDKKTEHTINVSLKFDTPVSEHEAKMIVLNELSKIGGQELGQLQPEVEE